jgi:hypothetical protein
MLKTLFYRLILLTLVGMLVAPFILKREDGTTIMSMNEFLDFNPDLIKHRYQQALTSIRSFLADDLEVEQFKTEPTIEKVTKIYKWQDENGEWHFSDEKSEKFVQEEVEIINDRNVMKFEDVNNNQEESLNGSSSKDSSEKESTDNKQDGENKDGIVKGYLNKMNSTVEGARNVQSQLDTDFHRKADAIESGL